MRVVVVAGSDAGHALPALELCRRFARRGDHPVLLTGSSWLELAAQQRIHAEELMGLEAQAYEDDHDAGAKIHQRAARMAIQNAHQVQRLHPDLIVADVLTACGGFIAEILGIPWIELSPHPLYLPSRGLPPVGSGLAVGTGWSGMLRDALLRTLTGWSLRQGAAQRRCARVSIGLPPQEVPPVRRLIATIPALEVPRPDWPSEAVIVGPFHCEPTTRICPVNQERKPLIVIAPSTAALGVGNLVEFTLSELLPGVTIPVSSQIVVSQLGRLHTHISPWAYGGLFRQDELLSHADVLICGSGHGIVTKALMAGVPMILVPGGGDQWELANRVARLGCGIIVRPLEATALVNGVNRLLECSDFRRAASAAGSSIHQVADPVQICHEAIR